MRKGQLVYLLHSLANPHRHYVGQTRKLSARLRAHNAGTEPATRDDRPWTLQSAHWFPSRGKADAFERYLKTGSGRAFAKRHF